MDRVFAICDRVVAAHGIMKIKTIGDSYMAVGFPDDQEESNGIRMAEAALELISSIDEVRIRIGIHNGPVVAGVLGKERMQFDVWGDTVNVASRMESTGEAGRIQVSEDFACHPTLRRTRDDKEELGSRRSAIGTLVERGTIEIKGKGTMKTYWLTEAS